MREIFNLLNFGKKERKKTKKNEIKKFPKLILETKKLQFVIHNIFYKYIGIYMKLNFLLSIKNFVLGLGKTQIIKWSFKQPLPNS